MNNGQVKKLRKLHEVLFQSFLEQNNLTEITDASKEKMSKHMWRRLKESYKMGMVDIKKAGIH